LVKRKTFIKEDLNTVGFNQLTHLLLVRFNITIEIYTQGSQLKLVTMEKHYG
jgi:hypothetical protein